MDKVTTMNLLFVAITNNLFMHVLPGGKLFFYGCLTEVPAATQQEERTAGLREFVFLRGREAVRPRTGIPVLSWVTFSGNADDTAQIVGCCHKITNFIEDGVKRNQGELKIFKNCLL